MAINFPNSTGGSTGGIQFPKAKSNGPGPNVASDVAAGFAKSAISHLGSYAAAGSKVVGLQNQALDQTVGRILNAVSGKGFTPTNSAGRNAQFTNAANNFASQPGLQPTNTAQKVGGGIETGLEYFAPGGLAAKGERAVTAGSQLISSPFLAAATRVLGKGAVQGAAAGTVNYGQTGGDLASAGQTALTAGTFRAALGTLGEISRALNLPTRLNTTVFKNSKTDVMRDFRTRVATNLKETDPATYNKYVAEGTIKVGLGGKPQVSETTAKFIADKEIAGTIHTMSERIGKDLLASESRARAIAANSGATITPHPNVGKTLDSIGKQYGGVGTGEFGVEAQQLALKFKQGGGTVDVQTALDARRLLDGLRIESSYNPSTNLSLQSRALKELSDNLRGQVNAVPGMGPVMHDYSQYIAALEDLAKEAARRGNAQVLGLISNIFLANAITNPSVAVPLTIAEISRRVFQSPAVMTTAARAINQGTMSAPLSGAIGSASNAVQ